MAAKVSFEGKRELRWLEIGHCLVCYMEPEVEFSDKLWDAWLDAVRRDSISGLIIASWGPTQPSHQQWRRATRLMRDRALPVAVVTDARHNFALAKAASWLGTNIQSYRWDDLSEALAFVGIGQDKGGDLLTAKSTVIALRDRFGAVVSNQSEVTETLIAPMRTHNDSFFNEASSDVVFETNDEIQRKLAEVQERFRSRRGAFAAATAVPAKHD